MRVVFKGQIGGAPTAFRGYPYQRGSGVGSFLKGLLRIVFPLARQAGKAIGREALNTGANIAKDIVQGQDLGTSVKKQSKRAGKRLLKKGVRRIAEGQRGGALGRAPPRRNINRRRVVAKRPVGRKGRKVSKRRRKRAVGDIFG